MSETTRNLELVHQELLGQFADIIRICDKHNIPYNLMCGTLLGAVRHKGFIPWDDDIDLLMTREAFARFEKVYPQECDDKYLLSYTNTWTPRIMSKNPTVADAFTDIFILDYLPQSKLGKQVRLFTLRMLQGMLKRNVDYSRFSLPQKILLFGTHVMGLPFSVETKTRWYAKISQKNKTGDKMHMSNGAFGLLTQEWDPALFETFEKAPFEHLTVSIPTRWHEVLVILFGEDYMTPPPEAERVAKHLDL